MKKHSIALGFGMVGAGVAGFIFADSDTFILNVLMGLCFGIFIGYFIAGLFVAKSVLLKQNFQKLGDLRGRSLDNIIATAGQYNSFKACTITDRDNANGYLYTWIEEKYSITLLFDENKICIGVNSETAI